MYTKIIILNNAITIQIDYSKCKTTFDISLSLFNDDDFDFCYVEMLADVAARANSD